MSTLLDLTKILWSKSPTIKWAQHLNSYKIMANMINSGSLQDLNTGETLAVHARQVAGNKVQIEVAEKLDSGKTFNPLAVFNASDSRFTSKARRAWLTCEPSDASTLLGLPQLSDGSHYLSDTNPAWKIDDAGRQIVPLNILNPTATVNGNVHTLRMQIVETTTPNEWQASNIETAAKRKGADGDYIMHNGQYIFSNTTVVFDKAEHVLLTPDSADATVGAKVNADTGEIFS